MSRTIYRATCATCGLTLYRGLSFRTAIESTGAARAHRLRSGHALELRIDRERAGNGEVET